MKIPLRVVEGKARMNDLERIVSDAIARFAATGEAAELERVKAGYLGRAGKLTEMLKGLGKLPPEARREAGALINAAKERIEAALTERREAIALAALDARLAEEALDVTLPRRLRRRRPGDRERLVQLHRAQQPGKPSGALDAGHLLHRGQGRRRAAT